VPAPDPAVKLAEIQAATARPWLDDEPADELGGVTFASRPTRAESPATEIRTQTHTQTSPCFAYVRQCSLATDITV
jgi:hypothetical protein